MKRKLTITVNHIVLTEQWVSAYQKMVSFLSGKAKYYILSGHGRLTHVFIFLFWFELQSPNPANSLCPSV